MPDIDLHFPAGGIDRSSAFCRQPNREAGNGSQWARTTPHAVNVRGFEPAAGRWRGGSRPGVAKYIAARVAGEEWVVQELNTLVGTGFSPPGGQVQASLSGRVVLGVAVSRGNVYTFSPGDTAYHAPANNSGATPPLNVSGLVYSSACIQQLFFVDGVNYRRYLPATDSVETWAAAAGALPVDAAQNKARLICTWRGRVVLSGLLKDPQNVFMSRVADPFDWDYDPVSIDATQPVAFNLSPFGLIGDVVTGLVPVSDDCLVVLGDSTVWMLRGDPLAGGQVDRISDAVGGAWGQAWAKDPQGSVYFFGTRGGVFRIAPGGGQVVRVSQQITQALDAVDTGENVVRLLWDDRFQGLHVFVTPAAEPAATEHYFWEQRANAWWVDRFGDPAHNPLCCCTYDGNLPGDRVPLLGCWDGFVRAVDPAAGDDDGEPIESEVLIGPLLTPEMDDVIVHELQAALGEQVGAPVAYGVFVGDTAEAALASARAGAAVAAGEWAAGRNPLTPVRRAGHALYVRLASPDPWQMEQVRCLVGPRGKVRRRA